MLTTPTAAPFGYVPEPHRGLDAAVEPLALGLQKLGHQHGDDRRGARAGAVAEHKAHDPQRAIAADVEVPGVVVAPLSVVMDKLLPVLWHDV